MSRNNGDNKDHDSIVYKMIRLSCSNSKKKGKKNLSFFFEFGQNFQKLYYVYLVDKILIFLLIICMRIFVLFLIHKREGLLLHEC
jgi:hypothetical protein